MVPFPSATNGMAPLENHADNSQHYSKSAIYKYTTEADANSRKTNIGPERIPLLSTAEDTMWAEKITVPNTQAVPSNPDPGHPEVTACNERRGTEESQLLLLVPPKTQIMYWIASAGVIAIGINAQYCLIGPFLLVLAAACLTIIAIMHLRGQFWRSAQKPRNLIIGLPMLLASELV
ncbi:hypothetical protein E8E12_005992 [Didymella heteroderae]|uniref:Uncharacterized protein n=1 Tax=Didymella heteroderae TaxID=1769908 RepID=A0A9P4WKC2_9PLEO|nr:hypothetical protein E8E12_005992 [Didymella heteroderae]